MFDTTQLEILADTLEPGSDVHDAAYNIMSSLRKMQRSNASVTPLQAKAITTALDAIAHFAGLDQEEQWGHDEKLGHTLMALCLTITS